MKRFRPWYERTGLGTMALIAVVASLPFGGLFVLLVPDTTFGYKVVQITAIAVLFLSYLAGPKYADRLLAKDGEDL